MIHPTAVIDPSATVDPSCEIGPFCMIGPGVTLGPGNVLHSHVVIERNTTMGADNEAFAFAAIGGKSQDLKYAGEPTSLVIGDRNVFRENCTIHRSTSEETVTRIGDDNLFLCYSHVAHECQIGNHVILSNSAGLAGHVEVEDYAIVSAMAGVHQFCRVGAHCIIGGMARIVQDVPPYMIAHGTEDVALRGINVIGLDRRGFSKDDIRAIKTAYKRLFLDKKANLSEQVAAFTEQEAAQNPHAKAILDFIASSQRGVTR